MRWRTIWPTRSTPTDIAAVLLRLAAGDEAAQLARIKALRILIQSNGAALLLDGHAELAARAETDGAHLTGIDAFKAAAPALKPARIAGCGGLKTRHDAMLAGESRRRLRDVRRARRERPHARRSTRCSSASHGGRKR